MGLYAYKALDAEGAMIAGTMEASGRIEVLAHLERRDATLISLSETDGEGKRTWRDHLAFEPASEDITGFTVDLAMLLKGGVTLNDALLILTQMETRRWLVRLVKTLHLGLSSGRPFSKVLADHPRLFSPLYVSMIEVAEVSGRLEEALTSIATERQRTERLRKRLVSALAYPAFLAVAALAVLVFVLLYIIPQFEGAIAGFRDRISPSALFVFELSETFRANLDTIIIAAVLLLLAVIGIKQFAKKQPLWIAILSRTPLTARIVTTHMTLTFCRTLEILLNNGVDISQTLRLIRGMITLPRAAEKMDGVIADVRSGKRLSQALAVQKLLPSHVVQMLRVGEETGNLADSAGRVAGFYENKLDAALGRLTAVAGPVLMMGVSMLIGWLILSIMSALMSINDMLV
ncbi:type II secretion system F family protein [Rhizobium sp. YIM 134829]|uniref:type II secretion system F family protein n=1 Tax=Rhizobium sp. YIM 134829 TaxID=3390453 RepID=UPI003977F8D3